MVQAQEKQILKVKIDVQESNNKQLSSGRLRYKRRLSSIDRNQRKQMLNIRAL